MIRHRRHRNHKRRNLIIGTFVVLALVGLFEAYSALQFYRDLSEGRTILTRLENRVDIDQLNMTQEDALATRNDFHDAGLRFASAQRYTNRDLVFNVAKFVPVFGKQVKGVDILVDLGKQSSSVGYAATDVLLAYSRFQPAEGQTAIQSGLSFLESQRPAMTSVDAGLRKLKEQREDLPGGLIGPLDNATARFDKAVGKLDSLVSGYNKAYGTLPALLGSDGQKTYLVLPQNDSELMPSGGLITSYAIATFNNANLEDMKLEYFGTLYDRWQRSSGGEYIEPPGPLKNYLKQGYSWGLGEAGWYPDFPTTARNARMFVEKGGAPPTDGIIAIDQQFVQGMLRLVGPVDVPEYGVTITADNLQQKTLELTRADQYVPGIPETRPKNAFLSFLAESLMNRVFSMPKDQWVSLLEVFDQQARERHLQLYFDDAQLQALITEYGFDGSIKEMPGDFLMLADASVNSTKLNMILENSAKVDIQLNVDGTATTSVAYTIHNPYDTWSAGRDPQLVKALMLDGVYGSYTRVYAPRHSRLLDVKVDDTTVGAEQAGAELGKQAFGRFFPVLPGETRTISFHYRTPIVVESAGKEAFYRLYIQKEAGMPAYPLTTTIKLPDGSKLLDAVVDGKQVGDVDSISTDFATDRVVELRFSAPAEAGGG
ncbi:MAG: DUF4012 domain-containing protein [Dehalococcoidia bacterium]